MENGLLMMAFYESANQQKSSQTVQFMRVIGIPRVKRMVEAPSEMISMSMKDTGKKARNVAEVVKSLKKEST